MDAIVVLKGAPSLRQESQQSSHLEVFPANTWDIHVMGRWTNIFVFLCSKKVQSSKVNLGKHHNRLDLASGQVTVAGYL